LEVCPPKESDDRLKTVLKALADAPQKESSCGCGEDDACSAKSSGKKAGKEAKKAVDKAMKKVEEKQDKKE
jgi:hypothetical protein